MQCCIGVLILGKAPATFDFLWKDAEEHSSMYFSLAAIIIIGDTTVACCKEEEGNIMR